MGKKIVAAVLTVLALASVAAPASARDTGWDCKGCAHTVVHK